MPLPYFRFVESDNYSSSYQCLNCYEFICGWAERWTYCPMCGMKSKGIWPCRSHETPRWAYERKIEDWHFNEKSYNTWVIIEESYTQFGDYAKEIREVEGDYRDALRWLKYYREEINSQIEDLKEDFKEELAEENPKGWYTEELENLKKTKYTARLKNGHKK